MSCCTFFIISVRWESFLLFISTQTSGPPDNSCPMESYRASRTDGGTVCMSCAYTRRSSQLGPEAYIAHIQFHVVLPELLNYYSVPITITIT